MRMHEGHAARISVLRQRQRMLQDGGTRIYPYCRVHSHLIAKSLISTTPLPPSQVCQLMHHRHNFSPQRDSQRSLKQVQCRNSRSIQRKVLPMYLYQCHILNLTRSNSSNRGITNACMDRKWDTFRTLEMSPDSRYNLCSVHVTINQLHSKTFRHSNRNRSFNHSSRAFTRVNFSFRCRR